LDEESLCQLTTDILESLGHQVSSFISPHSALDALRKFPGKYDAIMTDYSMPELNGENFIKAIRGFDDSIPILLVTGYSNMTTSITMKKWGYNAVIAKPYNIDQLQKILAQLLTNAS
jgi:DNA-binding NtrC family response regulator